MFTFDSCADQLHSCFGDNREFMFPQYLPGLLKDIDSQMIWFYDFLTRFSPFLENRTSFFVKRNFHFCETF